MSNDKLTKQNKVIDFFKNHPSTKKWWEFNEKNYTMDVPMMVADAVVQMLDNNEVGLVIEETKTSCPRHDYLIPDESCTCNSEVDFVATLKGMKGIVVSAPTKEQAIEEIITSLRVKFYHDNNLKPKPVDIERLKIDFKHKLEKWLVDDKEGNADDIFNMLLPHLTNKSICDNEWIRMDDSLPEKDYTDVLILMENGDIIQGQYCDDVDSNFQSPNFHSNHKRMKMIAWMKDTSREFLTK